MLMLAALPFVVCLYVIHVTGVLCGCTVDAYHAIAMKVASELGDKLEECVRQCKEASP
jgi:hypothetical protein